MKPAILASLLLLSFAGASPVHAQAPQGAAAQTPDSVRQAVRTDKRGLVEKNMKLTPEEAKKFWPIYDDYQRRLDTIVKRQNRAITDYINTEDSMTDANAKRITKEIFESDTEEQRLRERTVGKLQSALSPKKAARFMQIENKIRTLNRFDLGERIPLVR